MIEKLQKAIAGAESSVKRLDNKVELEVHMNVVGCGSKYVVERRFYEGYITALKYALVLAKEEAHDKEKA